MLFGFGNEKFQDFGWDVAILRQMVNKGVSGRRIGDGSFGRDLFGGFASGARRGRSGKREGLALFEGEDVAFGFGAAGADLEQVEFENGDGIGNKFGERAVHVRG